MHGLTLYNNIMINETMIITENQATFIWWIRPNFSLIHTYEVL